MELTVMHVNQRKPNIDRDLNFQLLISKCTFFSMDLGPLLKFDLWIYLD